MTDSLNEREMEVVIKACQALKAEGARAAAGIIASQLPFQPKVSVTRRATRLEKKC